MITPELTFWPRVRPRLNYKNKLEVKFSKLVSDHKQKYIYGYYFVFSLLSQNYTDLYFSIRYGEGCRTGLETSNEHY